MRLFVDVHSVPTEWMERFFYTLQTSQIKQNQAPSHIKGWIKLNYVIIHFLTQHKSINDNAWDGRSYDEAKSHIHQVVWSKGSSNPKHCL